MSAHHLAAVLACEEGNTSDGEAASRDGKDENLVHEAMSHKRIRRIPFLQDTVIFLLPSAFMSARRREILLPEIQRKGGEVTEDPSAATHCVITPFPIEEKRIKQLCTKYGVPDSCRCVPDSFLLIACCTCPKCHSIRYEPHGDRGDACCDG